MAAFRKHVGGNNSWLSMRDRRRILVLDDTTFVDVELREHDVVYDTLFHLFLDY